MLKKIRTLFQVTVNMKKQSVSMRRKLMLYWCAMIVTIGFLLVLILNLTGNFTKQDQELKENLEICMKHTSSELSGHLDHLLAQSITLSEQISHEIENILTVNGMTIEDLNDSPGLLLELQDKIYGKLYTTLLVSECSGAYFILDVTTNTQIDAAEYSRSGMYLRFANLNAKSAANQDIVYFRGIPDIARREQIELHNRWNLEFNSSLFPEYEQLLAQEVTSLSRTGNWSECIRLTDTWEDVCLLSVPILDDRGMVIGLCGVEISELYFYLSYPAVESPFGSMTTVLSPVEENGIRMEKGMMSSANSTNIENFEVLEIKETPFYNIYETKEGTYLGMDCELKVNSTSDKKVGIAVLVREDSYNQAKLQNRCGTIGILMLFFLIMFVISVILTNRFMKPIMESFRVIENKNAMENHKSGIYEIDRLLEFIKGEREQQIAEECVLPPNIEDLLLSFRECVKTLTVSEKRILSYYVEGYDAAEISEKAFISMSTVRKHSGNIYKKLKISSKDELMLYIELFKRCGRLEELMQQEVS